MKLSELINDAINALEAQGCYSVAGDNGSKGCLYRTTIDGKACKCIAGWMFSDERYCPSYEGMSVREVFVAIEETHDVWLTNEQIDILAKFQALHDFGGAGITKQRCPLAETITKMRALEYSDSELLPKEGNADPKAYRETLDL